jgi:hypothetical protein
MEGEEGVLRQIVGPGEEGHLFRWVDAALRDP